MLKGRTIVSLNPKRIYFEKLLLDRGPLIMDFNRENGLTQDCPLLQRGVRLIEFVSFREVLLNFRPSFGKPDTRSGQILTMSFVLFKIN